MVWDGLTLPSKRHIHITFWRTELMFRNKALVFTALCVHSIHLLLYLQLISPSN
eukprot:SAG31_NODE_8593_length_1423_cov_3.911631_3_plen_54_part_00